MKKVCLFIIFLISKGTCFSQTKHNIEYIKQAKYKLVSIDSISNPNYYMLVFSNNTGEIKVISKRANKCAGTTLQLNKNFTLTLYQTEAYQVVTKDSTVANSVDFLDVEQKTIRVRRKLPLYGAKEICNDMYIAQ